MVKKTVTPATISRRSVAMRSVPSRLETMTNARSRAASASRSSAPPLPGATVFA